MANYFKKPLSILFFRQKLKGFMVKCLESNEVPFYAIRDEEDKVPLLCDRTSIEQWRLAGKILESTSPIMKKPHFH